MDKESFLNLIKEFGIVGAGGAGFPTYKKYNTSAQALILNAAECEPLLEVDRYVLLNNTNQIIETLKIIASYLNSEKIFIAIKKKNTNLIRKLDEILNREKKIDIYLLDDVYPAGDEQELVYEVLKKVVPSKKIPIDVSAVVSNVNTVYSIYEALKENKPMIEKWITIAGWVNKPVTIRVPVGTNIDELISYAANGAEIENYKVLDGGPMMGKISDGWVRKTTNGLIVLPEDHFLITARLKDIENDLKIAKTACEQCEFCTLLCPRFLTGHPLKPHKLMRTLAWGYGYFNDEVMGAEICMECGLCSYFSCPLKLAPHRVVIQYKQKILQSKIKYEHKDKSVNTFRQNRRVPVKKLKEKLNLKESTMNYENTLFQTDKVRIYLKQHIGAKAEPVVSLNQQVKKSEKIADVNSDELGAAIHSSLAGTITNISENFIEIER